MAELFTNNAKSLLFAPITAAATTMDITPGDESLFPSIAGGSGDTFRVTIEVGSDREIVLVNSTSVNTFTMTRGQEGTVAQSWSASATVDLRVTAQQMQDLFPVDLTSQATGTLPPQLGGTGKASYTIGDIVIATAVNVLTSLGIGATNSLLVSDGVLPTYTSDPIVATLSAFIALKTGSTPAASGALRLSNGEAIKARNVGNSADRTLIETEADQVYIGESSDSVGIRNNTTLSAQNASESALINLFKLDAGDLFRILVAPIMENGLALSSRDNSNTVTIPLLEVDANDNIIFGDLLNRDQGFGRITPTARHHFGGSMGFPIREVTANTTYGDDFMIIGDTTSGNITFNLPPAATSEGRVYVAKKKVATNTLTINPNASELIETSTTSVLTSAFQTRIFQCDGTQWWFLVA